MDDTREGLVEAMRALAAQGLNRGTAGNCSLRSGSGMLITPTGVPAAALDAEGIAHIDLGGAPLAMNRLRPSSEWPLHAAVYAARAEVVAIVHCHSRHATAIACTCDEIPAFHYMVAVAGGESIRCAPYATFGTPELAAGAVAALDGRRACLLANHGQLATGASLAAALALAVDVEELAAQYHAALAIGGPRLLDAAEMARVLEKFRHYGQQAGRSPV